MLYVGISRRNSFKGGGGTKEELGQKEPIFLL